MVHACTVTGLSVLLQSPFPEIQGEELSISRRNNEVDHSSKSSLEVTALHPLEIAASPAAAVGTAVSPSLLRPSEVKSDR